MHRRTPRAPAILVAAGILVAVTACTSGVEQGTTGGAPTAPTTTTSASSGSQSTGGTPRSTTSPSVIGSGSAATSGTGRGSGDTAHDTDDEPVGTISWTACGRGLECGELAVPIDSADPGAGAIALSVIRRPATDRTQRIGSLFVNPGGPGASGVAMVRGTNLDPALNARFDIVSWDPRGVGESAGLDCEAAYVQFRSLDWSPDEPSEHDDLDERATAVADGCSASAPAILGRINTDDTARDLERLRRAVDDERLTFAGFSYGTYIGLRYAQLYPERVRAMVLDGVVDPTEDLGALLEGQVEALDAQVDVLFASCAADCPVADAAAVYDRVAAAVERQPLPGARGPVGPTDVAFAAIQTSYDESLHSVFLDALAAADRGDGRALGVLADTYFTSGSASGYLGVLCTDTPHPIGDVAYTALADRLAAVSPRFGAAMANEVRPCAFWRAPAVVPAEPVVATGSAPILVVGNRGDVATPFASAEKVARDLEAGVLLDYDGTGHTSFGKSPCVDGAINRYMIDLTVPAADTRC